MLRAMLGVRPHNGELIMDPHLPDEVGRVFISRLAAVGKRWNLEAVGSAGRVWLTT